MRAVVFALVSMVLIFPVAGKAGEPVSYESNGTKLEGYIARPSGGGNGAGVLVVHEWWGNNEYPRKRADMLAELGYTAFALDMYGEGKIADHPKDAGKFAGAVRKNMAVGEQRFRAALELLQGQAGVDADRIAAIGYCFGGSVVLDMARRGLPLTAVASFHGSLRGLSPVEPWGVKARVLVANGADDKFIKAEHIEQFKMDMDAAGAAYRFINYPGALHGFSNPAATATGKKFSIPLAYHPEVDAQSWAAMLEMFEATLK